MHSRLSSQMLFAVVLLPVLPAAAQTATGPGNQACPSITVSCPSDFSYGDTIVFKAHVDGGDPNVKPQYHWEVSAGTILQGQGSPSITLDTRGEGGHSPTATVTISGFSSVCSSTASCSLISESVPSATRLESYGALPKRDELRRLNALRLNWSINSERVDTFWFTTEGAIVSAKLKPRRSTRATISL